MRDRRPAGVRDVGRGPAFRAAVRLAGATVLALGLLTRPGLPAVGPALGSCAQSPSLPDAIAQADVVFVGSVVFLENEDRWATVRVEERWRGAGGLGQTVEVRGGRDPGVSTSVDRSYEMRRYLFVVGSGDGYLVDNICTATTPWTDALARLRPSGVQASPGLAVASPIADVNMDVFLPIVALVAALLVVILAYLIVLRSRRRPPDWRR